MLAVVMAILLPLAESSQLPAAAGEEAAYRYTGPLCVPECCCLYCWQMGCLLLCHPGMDGAVTDCTRLFF